MDSKAQDYRMLAEDAERKAREAREEPLKHAWNDVAHQWRMLADQFERHKI